MGNRTRRTNVQTVSRCIEKEVNSVADVAYYINVLTGTITQNNNIPLNEKLLLGENITTVDSYTIKLNSGVYKVIFSMVAEPSDNGISSVTLFINNQQTNILSSSASEANVQLPLSSNGIIVSTANSAIVSLVNTGNNSHAFRNVNFTIEKLS